MSVVAVPIPEAPVSIPPLKHGDRLTRAEFHRRYLAMPEIKKAELIEGVVYMPSPVRYHHHKPHGELAGWLGTFAMRTPGLGVADNGTVRLDDLNEPQPDLFLFVLPEFGGSVQLSTDDYLEGAPEFVVEIAGSSASVDLGPKKNAYLRNGVREYLVWRTEANRIDWFVAEDGVFRNLQADAAGVFRSTIFPGLWLDATAMLEGRSADALDCLQRGMATAEHGEFKVRLLAKKK